MKVFMLWRYDDYYGIYSTYQKAQAAIGRLRKDAPDVAENVTITTVAVDNDPWKP